MALISFEEAVQRIAGRCIPLLSEQLPVTDALGRFLSEPLSAHYDSPGFDSSAVDGYGVLSASPNNPLRVVGRAEAGTPFESTLQPGEAVQILTGAVVPREVVAIAMQEDCRRDGDELFIECPLQGGVHIRKRGEEYRSGDLLVPPGRLITPAVAGLATSQGCTSLLVGRAPKVAILCTGNELRHPGQELPTGAVFASSLTTLLTATRALGLDAYGILLPDDPATLTASLRHAFEHADLVLTTGGVSVGDRDYVRECADAIGVEEIFWKVAIKPGKPAFFGLRHGKLMFGLPGNPVATMVVFQLLVRPAILRLMGASEPQPPTLIVKLGEPISKRPGRAEFVRVRLEFGHGGVVARPTHGQDSYMIGGVASADALLHLPAERESFETGECAEAFLLKWTLL